MGERNVDWKDKKVLVTGGTGFIGSHLVKKLLDIGCDVSVADNFSRGRIENIESFLDKIHLYRVDLTELENCMLAAKDIDYIFHLAASVGGIHYIKRENVEGSTPSILMNTNMLEASVKNNVEKFLFASSACVYSEKSLELNEFKEEDAFPANPPTTYGWAKVMGEIQCRSYHVDYGLKTSSIRIFNCYGENENLDPRWSHVIPSLIRKAIRYPKEEFKLFGDGRQERAFLYVGDCVEGFLVAMEKIADGDAINLGSEEVTTISKLAEKIVKLSGTDIDMEYDLSGPQGTHRYCADTTKMKEVLDWSPKIPLDEGLRKVYDWARSELNVEE
jgi:nucleoside-diphosphate-sugar epimerase